MADAKTQTLTSPFHVIIIGGSIAGLTLAHLLTSLSIPFTLLEVRSTLTPQLGASIGIFPNGARILDQLGLFSLVAKDIEPGTIGYNRVGKEAKELFSTDFAKLFVKRHGYPLAFLDRKRVLEILWENLPEAVKGNVKVGKKVVSIEDTGEGVRVTTQDGEVFSGHLAAGADGVWSVTRREMWRNVDERQPGLVTNEEKNSLFADYSCIFGISRPHSAMPAGEADFTFNPGFSYLVVAGKGGRIYWFLFKKLASRCRVPNIPRFTDKDAEALAEEVKDTSTRPGITFADLWERRETATMTALEENCSKTWHYGRIVCLGDSVHKMTPNFGQGGNSALESAAVLASCLSVLSTAHQLPSTSTLDSILSAYAATRRPRAAEMVDISGFVTRIHALDGWKRSIFCRYITPRCGDMPTNMQSDLIMRAPVATWLPEPEQAKGVWMPYDDAPPISPWVRIGISLAVFLPLAWMDWKEPSGMGVAGRFAVNTMMLLEQSRSGNAFTSAQLAPVFIATPLPIPIWHMLHRMMLGPEKYRSRDLKAVRATAAYTTPLRSLAATIAPWMALSPAGKLLTGTTKMQDWDKYQRLEHPEADIPSVKISMMLAGIAAVGGWWFQAMLWALEEGHATSNGMGGWGWEEISWLLWAGLVAFEAGAGLTKVVGVVVGGCLVGGPVGGAVAVMAVREVALRKILGKEKESVIVKPRRRGREGWGKGRL